MMALCIMICSQYYTDPDAVYDCFQVFSIYGGMFLWNKFECGFELLKIQGASVLYSLKFLL